MSVERDFLVRVLLDNVEAIHFCEMLGEISQVWDDLIDKRAGPTDEDINGAFWKALIALPMHPFYREHQELLAPLMQSAALAWFDSNELSSGTKDDATLAWFLRDMLTNVVVHCALIVGGYDWVREVGPLIRKFFHEETIGEYLVEHGWEV